MSQKSPFNFTHILKTDPIFQAAKRAKEAGGNILNGTIGILMDEEGEPLLLQSTARALKEVAPSTLYSPLGGMPEYVACVRSLLTLPEDTPCIATVGGTGALSVLLRFGAQADFCDITIPTPSWANHARIAEDAGYSVHEVESLSALTQYLQTQTTPHIALLQSSCHNPTGAKVDETEWQQLADALSGSSHAVLLDTAYQGLGSGRTEDIRAIDICRAAGVTTLVAWSASKNHTIYGLRAGAAIVLSDDADIQARLCMAQRSLVSQAPSFGQAVVHYVQTQCRDLWEEELAEVRSLLQKKHALLTQALALPVHTEGMFVQLPLSTKQVETLTTKNIYLTPDARVNLAGIPLKRMDELIDGIRSILQ